MALLLQSLAHAATFVVNSTADTGGNSCTTPCTLRQAINAANATTAADTINFGFRLPFNGEILIQPTSQLPTITQPLTINGYSQSRTQVNTDPELTNAQLRIRIDGINAGSVSGLVACDASVTIRGLIITRFSQFGIDARSISPCTGAASIHGNFIGITNDGTLAANARGVLLGTGDSLGTAAPADRNLVIASNAVSTSGSSSIVGNLIKVDRNGLALGAGAVGDAIQLTAAAGAVVVGNLAAPNRIGVVGAGKGISVASPSSNNALQHNRFIASGPDGQAIDLGDDGLTANDPNDADTGANGLQNFPVITAAARNAGGLNITASLDVPSSGSASYDITLYASDACGNNGHGPGARLLGVHTRTISNSTESFTYTQNTSDPLPAGTVITATATRAGVGTSEMSACFNLDPLPLVVNVSNDVNDGNCNSSHCSLREAILAVNASTTGLQRIHFAIPPLTGTSEILIQPTTPLPDITKAVTIDGYTQPGTSVNTDPISSNAILRVRLNDPATISIGLSVCAETTIRGLAITGFFSGIDACDGIPIKVEGNFFGLASDGIAAVAGSGLSIRIDDSASRIGGDALSQRNVIANSSRGVLIVGPSTGTVVAGNLFGSQRTGQPAANEESIFLNLGVSGVRIGSALAPNRFVAGRNGITLTSTAGTDNDLASNSFASHVQEPIDLGDNGVTPNDPGDLDTGPNGLQNYPVLTRAERNANGLRLQGTIDSLAQTGSMTVYASANCDASGHGEGEHLLGSANAPLNAAFDLQIDTTVDLVAFPVITATATSSDGNSEFSACLLATDAPSGITVDSANDSTAVDGGCEIAGDGNLCTLREAITLANSQNGSDLIRFDIPGDGPHFINLSAVTQLPVITGGLMIDGYSEPGALANAAPEGSDAVIKIAIQAGSLQNLFRICTSEPVEFSGLALTGATLGVITSKLNDNASCALSGPVRMRGNFIGFRPDGLAQSVRGPKLATPSTVGGPMLADRNLIGGTQGLGMRIAGPDANGSVVQNNVFGADPELGTSVSTRNDIDLSLVNVSQVVVGGDGPNLSNRFTGTSVGVLVDGVNADQNSVFANSYSNHDGATGIDLTDSGTLGRNPNDVDDVDNGANEGQNTPILSSGSATSSSVTLNGVLDVPAGITSPVNYRLAFYRSSSCSDAAVPSIGREGQSYLGSILTGFTSASENFSVTINVAPDNGFITATATSPSGSTSEFSNCLSAPRPDPIFKEGFE